MGTLYIKFLNRLIVDNYYKMYLLKIGQPMEIKTDKI